MLRVTLILALSGAAGCDLVGLGSDRTVVYGLVLEDGRPVPGVEVALLGAGSASPFERSVHSYATGITDSRGFYTLSANWDEDNDWTECGFFAVDVEAHTKSALRLTTFADDTQLRVDCASHNTDRNFEFTTRLWYLGVQLGPDTIEVNSGSQVSLAGEFVRSLTPAVNSVHRDSTAWVWNGAPQWSWELTADSARYVNRTWDGCYTCTRRYDHQRLEVSGSGRIKAVLRIQNSPFADSVLIVVRPTTPPS